MGHVEGSLSVSMFSISIIMPKGRGHLDIKVLIWLEGAIVKMEIVECKNIWLIFTTHYNTLKTINYLYYTIILPFPT